MLPTMLLRFGPKAIVALARSQPINRAICFSYLALLNGFDCAPTVLKYYHFTDFNYCANTPN